MQWIVALNYFLHHFPLMCLGEVIIGDVVEALEMLFGRQKVPVNPRGPSINRKMEPSPTWDGGSVQPHVCVCACACLHVVVETAGYDSPCGHRTTMKSFKTH